MARHGHEPHDHKTGDHVSHQGRHGEVRHVDQTNRTAHVRFDDGTESDVPLDQLVSHQQPGGQQPPQP